MATLAEMVDEVKGKLTGYTLSQDRITYLNNSGGINTTDRIITVGSGDNFSKGIVEIDDELLLVDSYTKSSSTLTITPGFGRGYMGTTPTPHSQYAPVIFSPNFPRKDIKRAINDTIQAVYPKLWAVDSSSFSYNSVVNTYSLPDDVQDVIGVSYEEVGPSKEWKRINDWTLNPMSNVASFNSKNSIVIKDARIPAGRTILVHYSMEPNTLSSNSEDFADVTGLPQSCQDVIVLGAVYRMLTFIDAGRSLVTSAESQMADNKTPAGTTTNSAKYVYALFQQRLSEEADKLSRKYPVQIHYSR